MATRLGRSDLRASPAQAAKTGKNILSGATDFGHLSAEELSAVFAESFGTVDSPEVGDVLGIEHEFEIRHLGRPIDFKDRIHELDLGIRHLDPGDPNAYPLDSGSVLTSDGKEAEIALAPVHVRPGAATTASHRADLERVRLETSLGPEFEVVGYSTHLSVWTPPDDGERVARVFVSRFAPALMLLLDRIDSPGLLVRPRPSRTELGGEYISGSGLTSASIFAVGCVRSSFRIACGDGNDGPPIVQSLVVPTPERFGWYVDRTAFGGDLYAQGRTAPLLLRDGQVVFAQVQLEDAWCAARATIDSAFTVDELGLVDAIVGGAQPLPLDDPERDRADVVARGRLDRDVGAPPATLHGLSAWRRPLFELAPVMVTWDVSVFLMADLPRLRRAFVVVPRPYLACFQEMLEIGLLDGLLKAYLEASAGDRLVDSREKTMTAGLYDDVPARVWLLRHERDPDRRAIFRSA
jgi:hypothetical protein